MLQEALISPHPGLASNLTDAALRPLHFDVERKVWGDPTKDDPLHLREAGAHGATQSGPKAHCVFCGYAGADVPHHVNGNHRDGSSGNLVSADVLCHGWHHLEAQENYGAVLAYLPGLTPQDANHLQRTLMVALLSSDSSVREDAKELTNFLASHREYCRSAWGSSGPGAFSSVLECEPGEVTQSKEFVLEDLVLIHDPKTYIDHARRWAASLGDLTKETIAKVFRRVVNSPE